MPTPAQTRRREGILDALHERFPESDGYLVDLHITPTSVVRVVIARDGIVSTTHLRLARRSPKAVAEAAAVQHDAAEAARPAEGDDSVETLSADAFAIGPEGGAVRLEIGTERGARADLSPADALDIAERLMRHARVAMGRGGS